MSSGFPTESVSPFGRPVLRKRDHCRRVFHMPISRTHPPLLSSPVTPSLFPFHSLSHSDKNKKNRMELVLNNLLDCGGVVVIIYQKDLSGGDAGCVES